MDWPTTSTIDPVYLNQLMAQQEAERAVEDRSGLDEIVLQEERTSGWRRLKQRVLSTAAVLTFTAASLLPVQAAEPLAEPQILTVVPFSGGSGANGSQWYGSVRFDNTSVTETADGTVYVLPQQDNVLAASPQFGYSIGPGQSLIIDNLAEYFASIGDPQPNHGNVSVLVEPLDSVSVGALALIKNEHNLTEDNTSIQTPGNTNETTTDLLQGFPGISQTELLLPGDYVTIAAPSVQEQEYGDPVRTKPMHRMNLFAYAEQDDQGQDPELMCELIRADGTLETTRWFDLHTNGGYQLNNTIENGFQRTPLGNENIRCVVMNGKARIMPSVVRNNVDLPGVDDGYTTTPTITRLVEEATATATPTELEVNDPLMIYVNARGRPDTTVRTVALTGYSTGSLQCDPAQECTINKLEISGAAGTWQNDARITVRSSDGDFQRTITGTEVNITAEPADYTPVDSFDKTLTNLEEIANLIGGNINTVFINTNLHYTTDEVRQILTVYTNGTTGDQDPELERVIIKEGTNSIDYRRTDGGTAVWAGFTETQMDELRTIYE